MSISIGLESFTSEPANPPFLQDLSTHFLVETDSVQVPVQHHPIHPPVPHLHRLRRHGREQHFPKPLPSITIPHKQVLHIEPRFPQESREIWEKQNKPSNHNVEAVAAVGSESFLFWVVDGEVERGHSSNGCEVWVGWESGWEWVLGDLEDEDGEGLEGRGGEEGGGEGGLGGGEVVGEALEDGHLVDQLVDVRDVRCCAQAHAGKQGVPRWGWVRQRYGRWGRWRRWRGGGHFCFLKRIGFLVCSASLGEYGNYLSL